MNLKRGLRSIFKSKKVTKSDILNTVNQNALFKIPSSPIQVCWSRSRSMWLSHKGALGLKCLVATRSSNLDERVMQNNNNNNNKNSSSGCKQNTFHTYSSTASRPCLVLSTFSALSRLDLTFRVAVLQIHPATSFCPEHRSWGEKRGF